jgi:hypothetical protein
MTARRVGGGRSGFALALVVFMMFAIGVAATAAYEVVNAEFTLSTGNKQGATALAVARAGLQRFIAEQIGVVGDSVSYAIGNGIASVTTRKLYAKDARTWLYFVRSEGTVTDVRTPDSPARRIVGTYAWYHVSPVKHKAAMMEAASILRFENSWTETNGNDHAVAGDCSGAGTPGVAGAVATSLPTALYAILVGNPNKKAYANKQAVIDSAGIRWDVLRDPKFPVEFDGSPPDFTALPPDSFPVVRYVGNLTATYLWSGRGVLIVTGRLTMSYGFAWNGIILAGSLGDVGQYAFPYVSGTVIGGLDGTDTSATFDSGYYYYNYCDVAAANKALSYLDVVDNTVFEVNN